MPTAKNTSSYFSDNLIACGKSLKSAPGIKKPLTPF